jgi:hypothetical protein
MQSIVTIPFFTLSQLRVVRAVAVLGGLLQIMLFMFLCGILATVCFVSVINVTNYSLRI